jgi:Tol biopolymer transport system component
MNYAKKRYMKHRIGRIMCLAIILLLNVGCVKTLEKGDPGSLIVLFKCANSNIEVPVNNEFSNPVKVTINGYSGHAMEPSISRNGSYLFFNSLNDGYDTSLYYASRVDDVTFTSNGKIDGVNGVPRHLDAVASMDLSNNFYFISLRNYTVNYLNLFTGVFSGATGTVTGLQAQTGNFYIESQGWIVMDAEISPSGNDLYFVNAHFSGGSVPDRSDIGVAHKSAGNFNIDANSAAIMGTVNTADCLEYAPSISNDGLELFFTRLNLCLVRSEILVAKRGTTTSNFGIPERIGVITGFVEAPSLTIDGKTLYYHMNDNGTYTIYKVSRP